MDIDVFISYHASSSLHITESIVNKLESKGIKCWYAPRDVVGAYAKSIKQAINQCRVFILVLNKDSSESPHVLNELQAVTERLSKKEKVDIMPFHIADDEISDEADYYIRRMHWIDAITPPIYERIDELVKKVGLAINNKIPVSASEKTGLSQYKIISKIPQVRDVFYGRENEIHSIRGIFDKGNRIVFLEGIGGIGKSEIAKQYALTHKQDFDNVVFATYTDSIKKMVCDSTIIEIENLEQGSKSEDIFFEQKMQIIRSICDERTLIIVDNFDVDEDDELTTFLEGRHKVIFTTRNAHNGYPTIKIEPIQDEKALLNIFEKNYGSTISDEDIKWLNKFFNLIENHTYMIELAAKQMEASFLSVEELYNLINNGELRSGVMETIHGRSEQKTAFEHLVSLFNTSNLNDDEKLIMKILSLMGTKGIPAKRFKEWSGIADMNNVNKLIHRSWIRRENGQRLSIHPLMSEVVKKELKPALADLNLFLRNIAHFAYSAWNRVYGENLEVADNIYSILSYFLPFEAEGVQYFEPMITFLWQVGRFDDSIKLDHLLYDSCLNKYGEASLITGFVAKSLGGCYFNSRRKSESIYWYNQGLKCMLIAGGEYTFDLALAYEKVARCYTWDGNRDFDKAKENFDNALKIREEIKSRLEEGKPVGSFSMFHECDLSAIESSIWVTYMEIGRMYLQFGDYESALKYTTIYKNFMIRANRKGTSNFAYALYDTGLSLYHIGIQKKGNNNFDANQIFLRAEENLKAALRINLKMRGGLANDTIENQEVLGDVYAAMERYGEASNAYMAVISMLEKLYGEDYQRIATVKKKMMFELTKANI